MDQAVLPQGLIELQIAQIDLLMAMFPDEDAVIFDNDSIASLDALRSLQCKGIDEPPPTTPSSVTAILTLETGAEDATAKDTFQLEVAFSLTYTKDHDPVDEPPHPKVRLMQPSYMSKAEATSCMANAPKDQDLFTTIEHYKDSIYSHLLTSSRPETNGNDAGVANESLVRTWFYFPSISTRSKRDDIVKYAPSYGLSGFLLSGKPGVLCLEGTSHHVDAYMKFIKTESWSDIPAYHKKVTERLRQYNIARVFGDMQEITDTLGERRGERANRGDMKLLEAWLEERGLGEALMKVLI